MLSGDPAAVRAIDGSFALVASEGVTVRHGAVDGSPDALLPRQAARGPGAVRRRSHRHAARGADSRRPGRAVPSELHAHGPGALRRRSGARGMSRSRSDLHALLHAAAGHAARRISTRSAAATSARWPTRSRSGCMRIDARVEADAPIGVAFSGGIDSGSVFLVTYHAMLRLGLSPCRLKAFVLDARRRPGRRAGAGLSVGGRPVAVSRGDSRRGPTISISCETVRVLEDYKALDVECAAMGLRLCRGIRERYPEWRHLADGDGGDENLKDYPIEENTELTIRSVVDNLMLYQEGWGVGRIKHSLTYSGGLSRSYVRTYAPARRYGFAGLQPVHAAGRHRSRRRRFRSRR